MINAIRYIYNKLPPDEEELIYSKHVMDDYCNKLREKSASCWSLLRKAMPSLLKCIGPRHIYSFIRQLSKALAGQTAGLHVNILAPELFFKFYHTLYIKCE